MSYYIDQLMEEEQKRKLADLLMAGEAGSFPAFMPQPDYSGERGVGNYPAPQPDIRQQYGQPLQDTLASMRETPQSDYPAQQQTMAQFFANPQPEQPPQTQADRRSAGTTVGSYGNTQSRYVRDPETGDFIPNPDYISSGIENDPSTVRVTGQMMNNTMQQGGATADSMLKNLFAMMQPGYREANPDMAYSSRTHNQGVQNIQDRPEYKQFAAMMALEGPAAKAAKDRADAAQLQAKPADPEVNKQASLMRMYQSIPDGPMKQAFGEKHGFANKPEKRPDAELKKEAQMEGLGDAIAQAKALLEGRAPDQKSLPTGSGIGSMWDALAGQVGSTPSGATEAQRMKVLGGALTSKMPRMEGPQSDKDTQLYKEMAGLVGDDTVPIPRRLDALDQVSKLWLKYEKPKSSAANYDADKEARYQAWKKARGM